MGKVGGQAPSEAVARAGRLNPHTHQLEFLKPPLSPNKTKSLIKRRASQLQALVAVVVVSLQLQARIKTEPWFPKDFAELSETGLAGLGLSCVMKFVCGPGLPLASLACSAFPHPPHAMNLPTPSDCNSQAQH